MTVPPIIADLARIGRLDPARRPHHHLAGDAQGAAHVAVYAQEAVDVDIAVHGRARPYYRINERVPRICHERLRLLTVYSVAVAAALIFKNLSGSMTPVPRCTS